MKHREGICKFSSTLGNLVGEGNRQVVGGEIKTDPKLCKYLEQALVSFKCLILLSFSKTY